MGRPAVRGNRNRLVVLGYHSIEPTHRWPAAPGSGIATFTQHLRLLRRLANVVPLDRALRQLSAGGPLPPRAVAITFDDGYRDNLTLGVPALRRLELPATVFLVPGYLSGQVHAWWERLGWAVHRARARSVDVEGRQVELTEPAQRAAALEEIEQRLKDRDHADRLAAVERLVAALDPDGAYYADELFLDWDGARSLVAGGISIGSHTMGHAILGRETADAQRADLRTSRATLADALQTPVEVLAYPNGQRADYDAATIDAARDAGYSHAVTTWGPSNTADTPPYEIARRMVSTDTPPARLAARLLRDFVRTPEPVDAYA